MTEKRLVRPKGKAKLPGGRASWESEDLADLRGGTPLEGNGERHHEEKFARGSGDKIGASAKPIRSGREETLGEKAEGTAQRGPSGRGSTSKNEALLAPRVSNSARQRGRITYDRKREGEFREKGF